MFEACAGERTVVKFWAWGTRALGEVLAGRLWVLGFEEVVLLLLLLLLLELLLLSLLMLAFGGAAAGRAF